MLPAHLRTNLFVVLGHEGCGAVHAAWAYEVCSVIQRSRIQTLVQDILPGLLDPDLALPERRGEGALRFSSVQIHPSTTMP